MQEVILLKEMALVAIVYMVLISKMRTLSISTMVLAGSAWLMLVKIRMGLSSTSLLFRPLGLMGLILALGKSYLEW